ncbi:acyltransferase family protein [Mesorhizobium sp. WSM4906]|uniref:acyltransferase family protein n=1 Tax=Mesorhizobium sp. WSM4906 TaxID=3038546 RepID=UPI0024162B8F|nr:acyltransferase family protein [Mesorhizobium sp. WSM4906]WFP73753.1 acyltransferase family protein [Mesorhizobium sp. WSM4906]
MVAVFHVWPFLIPGGYVGVDVFFVISGYLITGVLVREAEATGKINIPAFYLRRARRLLPTAMLVLLVVGALTPLCLPASQWVDGMAEMALSAVQLENWRLAAKSVDYLARDSAPSPVQHYWSLSIEEQFYVVWPGLIMAGLSASRLFKLSWRAMLLALFGTVIIASLAASMWLTAVDPAPAYFVTFTRIWELALGGFAALEFPAIGNAKRRILGVLGIAGILAAGFLFSSKTPFPGYAALLPTLATILVILSGRSSSPLSVFALLKSRPFQFVGDISYSLYLWHWPIVVYVSQRTGETVGPLAGTAILLASVGLAAISKVHVEDRFRSPRSSHSVRRRLGELAAALVVFSLVPLVALFAQHAGLARERAFIASHPNDYPGARSLFANEPVPVVTAFAPPLATIKQDLPPTEACRVTLDGAEPLRCRFGDPNGHFKVFLIGDSHAEQWVPAFEGVAADRGWNASSFTKYACPLFPAMLALNDRPYTNCLNWGQRMLEIIQQEKPDLIILGQRLDLLPYFKEGEAQVPVPATLIQLWRRLEALGAKVIVIADTPSWGVKPENCPDCSIPYKSIARPDPLIAAHQAYGRPVGLIDFNDFICPNEHCPAVIGNVYVWRDKDHLTATYSSSMTEVFGKRLDAAIAAIGTGNFATGGLSTSLR